MGATEAEMTAILKGIRKAQWRWDMSAASHGASFHAPVETGRIISTGLAIVQEARIKLARLLAAKGFNEEVAYPDIATKAKAQQFIGLDMAKERGTKATFKQQLVPQWKKKAEERQAQMPKTGAR
jgi:nitrite reductase (cytochrome c-552)